MSIFKKFFFKETKQEIMNQTFLFKNEDELFIAISSGLIPESHQKDSVKFTRWNDNSIVVSPKRNLTKNQLKALEDAGVRKTNRKARESASCWGELFSPREVSESEISLRFVIFLLYEQDDLINLAGELLRLGCDRQSYAVQKVNGRKAILLRAAEPPYYSVASSFDRSRTFKSFVPIRNGQEAIFTEFGFTHPLAKELSVEPGTFLLVKRNGSWVSFKEPEWHDIYTLVDFKVPDLLENYENVGLDKKLEVELSLTRAVRNERTLFWVIEKNAIETIDKMVSSLPNDILNKFLFAVVGENKNPTIVLRSRTNQAPEIDINANQYVPFMKISNLFIPKDKNIEPPLRREKVRELLAPNDETIAWISPIEENSFEIKNIEEASFSPLIEWVDYVIRGEINNIEPWIKSSIFDVSSFVSVGVEWADKPKEKEKKKEEFKFAPHLKNEEEEEEEIKEEIKEEEKPKFEIQYVEEKEQEFLEEKILELENQFFAINAPFESVSRAGIWAELARLCFKSGNIRDGHICWSYATWSTNGIVQANYVKEWFGEYHTEETYQDFLKKTLDKNNISRTDVQKIVSILALYSICGKPQLNSGTRRKIKSFIKKNQKVLTLPEQRILIDKANMEFEREDFNLDKDCPTFLYKNFDKLEL